jgi:hypothetical protein
MRRRLTLLAVLVALAAAPAALARGAHPEAEPPVTVAQIPGPSGASQPRGIMSTTGPIFLGLVAAIFLMVGAMVGKNDKHGGR